MNTLFVSNIIFSFIKNLENKKSLSMVCIWLHVGHLGGKPVAGSQFLGGALQKNLAKARFLS